MKKKIYFTLISCLLLASIAYCQNETKKWYFGNHAGLDFSTNQPTVLTNGAINTLEGCASVSDTNANLLFYTDGVTIWDKTHNVMANGNGLLGHQSTTQSSLIIKQPGSTNLYYVFTLDAQGYSNGLRYSIVDINLAAGNGSMTIKNVPLYTPSEEKLTAVLHANGSDVWILSREYNSNNFRAYLLTSTGINTVAVISSIGNAIDQTDGHGYLKTSPDGKKIGLVIQSLNIAALYDFDKSSGLVSNEIVLTNSLIAAYGCEFSPDGSKFYATGLNDTNLYQWNLCAGNSNQIIQSKTVIYSSLLPDLNALQLAPNNKIYLGRFIQFQPKVLSIINNPNELGLNCNFVDQGQTVSPGICQGGLPNFPSYYFYSGATLTLSAFGSYSICKGESKTLNVSGANTYTWNGSITGASISVSPTVTSNYTVAGTSTAGCVYTASTTISVLPCTDVIEYPTEYAISIAPNPASTQLLLRFQNSHPVSETIFDFKIVDSFGKPVKAGQLRRANTGFTINVSDLDIGIYYLKLESTFYKNFYRKFIIAR